MKTFITTILLFITISAFSQTKEAPKPTSAKADSTVQVKIEFTEWQLSELKAINDGVKALQDRQEFLLKTIYDMKKVDATKIIPDKSVFENGVLTLTLKK